MDEGIPLGYSREQYESYLRADLSPKPKPKTFWEEEEDAICHRPIRPSLADLMYAPIPPEPILSVEEI